MGEVIEINIISKRKNILDKLLQYSSLSAKGQIVDYTIEIMDNWEYDNVFELNDIKLVQHYIDDRIICITQKKDLGVNGISVENIEGEYNYCVWYNPMNAFTDKEYLEYSKIFIEYFFCNMMQDEITLCAIGKETLFIYDRNIYQIVNESHNIDIWLVDKGVYIEDCFSHYKSFGLDNYKFNSKGIVIVY